MCCVAHRTRKRMRNPYGTCEWCERENLGDPSDFYHRKQCKRDDAYRRIAAAAAAGMDTRTIEAIKRELGSRYVGD